jgi:hypothetical protein
MDPARYFSAQPGRLDAPLAAGLVQGIAQEMLDRQFNGYVRRSDPYGRRPQEAIAGMLPFIRTLASVLESPLELGSRDDLTAEDVPGLISEHYRVAVEAGSRFAGREGEPETIRLERKEGPPCADERVRRLLAALDLDLSGLAPFVVCVVLHGSLADGTSTAFSDVDTVVVLKDSTLRDPAALRAACEAARPSLRSMIRFDPLQHHGHMIVPEGFLTIYSQAILPLATLRDSFLLLPDRVELRIQVRRPGMEIRRPYWQILQRLRLVVADSTARPGNLYDLKLLLSQFMLLPALHLGLVGRFVNKKESFEEVRRELSDREWEVMREVTALRSEWPRCEPFLLRALLRLFRNPWLAQAAYWRGWPMRAGIPPRVETALYHRMLELAERMWVRAADA